MFSAFPKFVPHTSDDPVIRIKDCLWQMYTLSLEPKVTESEFDAYDDLRADYRNELISYTGHIPTTQFSALDLNTLPDSVVYPDAVTDNMIAYAAGLYTKLGYEREKMLNKVRNGEFTRVERILADKVYILKNKVYTNEFMTTLLTLVVAEHG